MRPETMKVFDDLRNLNVLTVQDAKQKGEKVVGCYCTYSPQELILAAGAHSVTLCGTRQEPVAAAERDLPRNLCPLIKSSYGFAVTGKCPYFEAADLLVAETTCDGKKKMYELMSKIKPMHTMNLPQSVQAEDALEAWTREMHRLKNWLEEKFGVEITEEKIRESIKLMNRERNALRRLHRVTQVKPAPITGVDLLVSVWTKGFNINKEDGIKLVEELIAEIEELTSRGSSPFAADAPRILLTGCPVGFGSEKVVKLLEECGASVVAFENCSGYKALDRLVDEDESKDVMVALAEKYLNIPCSCMAPNEGRLDLIGRLASEYQVDGVVDLTWQACHTYNVEAFFIRDYVQGKLNLPYLHLETDYSESDVEQIRVRVQAFLELIQE
ncbi:double-cubane-cluster-containing anaerobic reductase [Desulforamulus ruminis]|uniref:2-hydroxyglutaryl-CoA dehydratase D-component n=1 Tax=Desulforamulus ruminis (strain ATCC 23193 / DSM 2154 / NCIMB 8452 / DL) TaxID=696281 RepID=F6DRZ0_DESRL|nr:double-cubane-cluster-containing anaerobic reductase [Desulforamulus ruminis]AEG61014.1 2-hydroxyglutaryl-CoA dehydratase D-component [Desulforamulus ruminis DSM 2154]